MVNKIGVMGLILGILYTLLYSPYVMAKGIYTLTYGKEAKKFRLLWGIPVLNVIRAETLYTGKVSTIGLAYGTVAIAVVLRVSALLMLTDNAAVNTIVWILLLATIVGAIITNFVFVFRVLTEAAIYSTITVFILTVLFPIGQYFIGTNVACDVATVLATKDTFK